MGERLRIGQLLARLLAHFEGELMTLTAQRLGDDHGIRVPHSKALAFVDAQGTRLTDLAQRAGMVPSAMAELVDDLEAKGYLERVPDPSDGRAKLIRLTERGWVGVRAARATVEDLEREYGQRVGQVRFEQACALLQELLDRLDADPPVPDPAQAVAQAAAPASSRSRRARRSR